MDASQLAMVENYATKLYQSTVQQERLEAERVLAPFMTEPSYLQHCRNVLEHTQSPFATTFAAFCIDKLINKHFLLYDMQTKIELRNYLLQYLYSHFGLPQYTVGTLVTAVCRITRLGWLESDELAATVDRVTTFINTTPDHCSLTLHILTQLVTEINMQPSTRTGARQRKVAIMFRDRQLLGLFQLCIGVLRSLVQQGPVAASSHPRLLDNCFQLLKACLSFDFIGTSVDDSADDAGTVQVPTSWKPVFDDGSVVGMLFQAYGLFPAQYSSQAMDCLVYIASFRRSVFTVDAERIRFLSSLMNGLFEVLSTGRGLNDVSNFHECCRLLARLKSSFQLSEFIACDVFPAWIKEVYGFTLKALRAWQWAPNSVQYILNFWNRLLQSVQFNSKVAVVQQLNELALDVVKAYVLSRLESVQTVLQNPSIDNPLDDDEALFVELEVLGSIARSQYNDVAAYLLATVDPLMMQYQDLLNNWNGSDVQVQQRMLIEGQCTWFNYIFAKIIGARIHTHTTDDSELLDGDLACRVLQLIGVADMWLSSGRGKGVVYLQLSFLSFLQSLRKTYVAEQAQRSSKVYGRLSAALGIQDQSMLLDIITRKLISSLKFWEDNERVVRRTLDELLVLVTGFSSARLLVKLDVSRFLLKNFSSSVFPFLDRPENVKGRAIFAQALTRLLFTEDEVDTAFEEFMAPVAARLDQLLALPSLDSFRMPAVRDQLIGLLYDLRGVCTGCGNRRQYGIFFDWYYPKYSPVLLRALEANRDNASITSPLLRFYAELVHNKNQRCLFDTASANGILLFREISTVLVTYGSFISEMVITDARKYELKYKGIKLCLVILKRALSGQYVNFGVFKLYGDKALDNAIGVTLKMTMSIPLPDLIAHTQVYTAWAEFLEFFLMDHLAGYLDITFDQFLYLMASITEGLRMTDVRLSSLQCTNLDHLCNFFFKQLNSPKVTVLHPVTQYVKERPDLLQYNMHIFIQMLCLDDSHLYWSLARPLLSLILLDEKFFADYRAQLIELQPPERRKDIHEALSALMNDMERTMSTKNRDRFAQNITVFRRYMSNVTLPSMPMIPSPFEALTGNK